jgi:hypothetical protein
MIFVCTVLYSVYSLTPQVLLLLAAWPVGVPPAPGLHILNKLLEVKEHLLGAKEHLLAGLLGDGGNCGCPCRDYFVAKCHVEYVEHCSQAGHAYLP